MINISKLWGDEKFKTLSPNAKLLYIYLCTQSKISTLGVVKSQWKHELHNLIALDFIMWCEGGNIVVIDHFQSLGESKPILRKAKKEFEDATGELKEVFNRLYNVEDFEVIEKVPLNFNNETMSCFLNCLGHFPDYLHPNGEKGNKEWLKIIHKLHTIDKLSFDAIEDVVKKARQSEFWSKNFLALPKLRTNNKDGVKYYIVFAEQFKIDLTGEKNNQGKFSDTGW